MAPTMHLRWVDVSTCPELSTRPVLQQWWKSGEDMTGCDVGEWREVLDAGHVTTAPNWLH